ncbi:MAG TPA: hypothetical protein VGE18_01340 [Candidatus Paceibacterota bacterium]
MLDKKLTRKEFIFSIGSFIGLLAVSGLPQAISEDLAKKMTTDKKPVANGYGNHHYGGKRA